MPLFHSQRIHNPRSKNTRREGLSEASDVVFVGGGEVDEAGKVCCYSIEGGDVVEAKLTKSRLEHFDARGAVRRFGGDGIRSGVDGCVVDCLDDFIDLGGNKRV